MLRAVQKGAKSASLFQNAKKSKKVAVATKSQKRTRYDVSISLRFVVPDEQKTIEKLKTANAKLEGESEESEIYYDRLPVPGRVPVSEAFVFGKHDTWLRDCDGEFRVRTPSKEEITNYAHTQKPVESGRLSFYQEFVGEKAIRRELSLQQDATKAEQKTLAQDLAERCIVPFATIKTKKSAYSLTNGPDNFLADIYSADFGYTVGRIGLIVPNAKARPIENSVNRLQAFAKDFGLDSTSYAPDIVIEYIYRNYRADFFKALVDAKVALDPTKK